MGLQGQRTGEPDGVSAQGKGQAVLDALADAETLRRVAVEIRDSRAYQPPVRAAAFDVNLWLIPAGDFGAKAARYIKYGWPARGEAWDAAHSAFRAVPELRG